MNNPASRPEIAVKRDNMKDYDTIFVGFPIWWYVAPTIINTFLESYDLSGKTIILYHICKVRAIKVCTGEAIITELYTRQIAEKRILIQMTIDEHTL